MPVRCAVKICKNGKKKGSEIHFYKFPLLLESLLRAWLKAINRKDWIPTESSRICEFHFKSTDFVDHPAAKRKRLKPDVIPSKNLFSSTGEISEQDVLIESCSVINSVPEEISEQDVPIESCSIINSVSDTREISKQIKRKVCCEESPNKKIKELEDEVQHLNGIVESLQKKIVTDLEVQANMFRQLMYEKEKNLKER